ncbi:hypothetical protein [Mesorhizobium sp. CO1-1-8]|uniref:hypothetical protein n=1 Tax=Mesorhizobium sp. CO1-1-8 TaxID=2876631 RepID=UPI001CD0C34C|nr:hypothetical protein [Mesorhizobium sp. CO1-1-8]MBZ9777126.1 hypothetical protein [Mesorhizobium sp. CO1-1-8]
MSLPSPPISLGPQELFLPDETVQEKLQDMRRKRLRLWAIKRKIFLCAGGPAYAGEHAQFVGHDDSTRKQHGFLLLKKRELDANT